MRAAMRQLRLPGLDRRAEEWSRAQRDLGPRDFRTALERNGFRPLPNTVEFADADGRRYIGVYRTDPIRIRRRATIAKLIKERGL